LSCAATRQTLRAVSGRTAPLWFSVRETVAVETLARRAISPIFSG
jgi:hypothetical protein